MGRKIIEYQEKVLRLLSGKLEGFYLAGGTVLSLYYFHHRESLDLDFFTQNFQKAEIKKIIDGLASPGKDIKLTAEQNKKNMVRMAIYIIRFNSKDSLKIDFVEDYLKIINRPKIINGIPVLSLEDIYLRKIYTITGSAETIDEVGRKKSVGARQEAKDFFDLFCLSTVFLPIYKFTGKYCNSAQKESLVRWFRTYDRMNIKSGLMELKTNKEIDYKLIEAHFKRQIGKLIESEVGL